MRYSVLLEQSIREARAVQSIAFRNLQRIESELARDEKSVDTSRLEKAVNLWRQACSTLERLHANRPQWANGPQQGKRDRRKLNGHAKPTPKPQAQTPTADPVKPMRAQDAESPATDPTKPTEDLRHL